jgi:hypothetical protein
MAMRLKLVRVIALGVVTLSTACAPQLSHDRQTIYEHVIAVDGRGRAHDPNNPNGPEFTVPQFRHQIHCILSAIDGFENDPRHGERKIMIFVHGGLNDPNDSLAAADAEMDCVMDAGYYPVYLDWNSGFVSTYGEHVISLTQGEPGEMPWRVLLTPAYVVADMGRALCRFPIVWTNQFGSDIESAESDIAALPKWRELASTQPSTPTQNQRWATRNAHGQAVSQMYEQLRSQHGQNHLHVYIGPDFDVDPWHMTELAAVYFVTLPAKLLTEPIIDWLGSPAWQVMSRRTLIAFDGDIGSDPNNPNLNPANIGALGTRGLSAHDYSYAGAMEIFREELQRALEDVAPAQSTRPANRRYQIILVGHSMGTMVLNEWLRRDILEGKGNLYSNIVWV